MHDFAGCILSLTWSIPLMPSHEPDDEAIRARSAHRNVYNLDDASIILRDLWANTRSQYPTLEKCHDALAKDSELYRALKHAHTEQKPYDGIRNWRKLDQVEISALIYLTSVL